MAFNPGEYQWRTVTEFETPPGADYYLKHGLSPTAYESWQTRSASSTAWGPGTIKYWYQDSNRYWNSSSCVEHGPGWVPELSSTANYDVAQTWTAAFDSNNNLTITVYTDLNLIYRDNVNNPLVCGQAYYMPDTPERFIKIYDKKDPQTRTTLYSTTDSQIATAHTISGSVVHLPTVTITLAPGQATTTHSLLVHNKSNTQEGSEDWIWIGVEFYNPQPASWTATLNYNANGGSGAPSTQTASVSPSLSSHAFSVSVTVPTWGNYIFLGWSDSPVSGSGTMADVDYIGGDTVTVTQSSPSKTIYAVWEKDYRPGERKISGTWRSHNRSAGKCERKVSGTWTEMRTIDGGVGTGNEPTRKSSGTWYNQRKVGLE